MSAAAVGAVGLWATRSVVQQVHRACRRADSSGISGRRRGLAEAAVGGIAGQAARAVEDREAAVLVSMDPHPDLDEVVAVAAPGSASLALGSARSCHCRPRARPGRTGSRRDRPRTARRRCPPRPRRPRSGRCAPARSARRESGWRRHEKAVGGGKGSDPGEPELLRQASLQGAEQALHASARPRRLEKVPSSATRKAE